MTNDNLHDTTDASKWAAEFCKRWPSALCQIEGEEVVEGGDDFEATMIGWFANAIQTGADHAQAELQAAVAAELEAVARWAEGERQTCNNQGDREGAVAYRRMCMRVRARTDTDAQAALEAVKREARNEALREVVVKVESHIDLVSSSSPTTFALDWVRDDVLALMEDTDDE